MPKEKLYSFSDLGHPYCSDCLRRFIGCPIGYALVLFPTRDMVKPKCIIYSKGVDSRSYEPGFEKILNEVKKEYDVDMNFFF
jgi:hypothetical protein